MNIIEFKIHTSRFLLLPNTPRSSPLTRGQRVEAVRAMGRAAGFGRPPLHGVNALRVYVAAPVSRPLPAEDSWPTVRELLTGLHEIGVVPAIVSENIKYETVERPDWLRKKQYYLRFDFGYSRGDGKWV